MSEWNSHIAAQECTVRLRRLVRMRFLYQPIIPPRTGARGFLLRRSESPVLFGRTEVAHAIARVAGERSGRFAAAASLLKKKTGGASLYCQPSLF